MEKKISNEKLKAEILSYLFYCYIRNFKSENDLECGFEKLIQKS